jgi:hypothetical protein
VALSPEAMLEAPTKISRRRDIREEDREMTDQLVSAIVNLLLALSLLADATAAGKQPVWVKPSPAPAPAAAEVPLPGSLCGLEEGSP